MRVLMLASGDHEYESERGRSKGVLKYRTPLPCQSNTYMLRVFITVRNTVIRPMPMPARTVELLHGTDARGEGIQQRKKRIDGRMGGWMELQRVPLGDDVYDYARGFAQRIHSSIQCIVRSIEFSGAKVSGIVLPI
jgi:hypothetical protein